MLKTVLAGATALVIAGGSLAIAQSGQRNDARRWQPSAEEISALTDLRVARIKSGLRLTAEQEQNWPAVEAAIRELAKERAARISERRAAREAGAARPGFIERMRRGADAMSTQAAGLKKALGALDLTFLGVGAIIGTGIFVLTGTGAVQAGPALMLSFIIAAIACGFAALAYAEFASTVPVVSGADPGAAGGSVTSAVTWNCRIFPVATLLGQCANGLQCVWPFGSRQHTRCRTNSGRFGVALQVFSSTFTIGCVPGQRACDGASVCAAVCSRCGTEIAH